MKPLLIILKTLIIGYLWSIIFIDGIRVVLLVNWHFDILMREHWLLLSDKWNSGDPVSRSEMGFLLIVVSIVPLWLAGWVGLCLVKWKQFIKRIVFSPLYLYRKLTLKTKPPVVVKKKSVNEEMKITKKAPILKKVPMKRPPLPSATLMQSNINNNLTASSRVASPYTAASKKNPETPLNHALFNFDDDDFDLDFDFDQKEKTEAKEDNIPTALIVDEPKTIEINAEPNETPKSKNIEQTTKPERTTQNTKVKNKPAEREAASSPIKESHTPVLDVLTQKGFDVIPSAIIKNNKIDYIAVSKKQLFLCLVDKEVGDWLADEEKFNDEEPLWFSESSHRISPVRKVEIARDILKTKLAVADLNFELETYVIIQAGNIINAEDMFEIWSGLNVNVCRINRGSPKEIRLFSKTLDSCDEKTDKNTLEKLKKLIRSLA